MIYMGSKNKIAKQLVPVLNEYRKSHEWYVEPFCGGCNIIDKIEGKRIAADINPYLISLWKYLVKGWQPPHVTEEQYHYIRTHRDRFFTHYVGSVGFISSFRGKFFGGAIKPVYQNERWRDYQQEQINNVLKQVPYLKDVWFQCYTYDRVGIPSDSLIYCDPPYKGTTGYYHDFNHESFWDWCREKERQGHTVLVSEYEAPDDFEVMWSMSLKSSMSINGNGGVWKHTTEKLFRYKGK